MSDVAPNLSLPLKNLLQGLADAGTDSSPTHAERVRRAICL